MNIKQNLLVSMIQSYSFFSDPNKKEAEKKEKERVKDTSEFCLENPPLVKKRSIREKTLTRSPALMSNKVFCHPLLSFSLKGQNNTGKFFFLRTLLP